MFAIVAFVGGGRLAYSLVAAPWLKQRALRPIAAQPPRWRALVGKWFVPFAIGFVIVYPAIVIGATGFRGALKWIDNFGIQILIYVMLGWGLNIVVGLAGLLDLGYVAFYAVGAYSYALLAKELRLLVLAAACRSPAFSPRSGASCSAFRCCGCAATISPSSRWRSAKSSASS